MPGSSTSISREESRTQSIPANIRKEKGKDSRGRRCGRREAPKGARTRAENKWGSARSVAVLIP